MMQSNEQQVCVKEFDGTTGLGHNFSSPESQTFVYAVSNDSGISALSTFAENTSVASLCSNVMNCEENNTVSNFYAPTVVRHSHRMTRKGAKCDGAPNFMLNTSVGKPDVAVMFGIPFVVLERLTDSDVKFMSRRFRNARVSSRRRCTEECRLRALTKLCSLRLIDCSFRSLIDSSESKSAQVYNYDDGMHVNDDKMCHKRHYSLVDEEPKMLDKLGCGVDLAISISCANVSSVSICTKKRFCTLDKSSYHEDALYTVAGADVISNYAHRSDASVVIPPLESLAYGTPIDVTSAPLSSVAGCMFPGSHFTQSSAKYDSRTSVLRPVDNFLLTSKQYTVVSPGDAVDRHVSCKLLTDIPLSGNTPSSSHMSGQFVMMQAGYGHFLHPASTTSIGNAQTMINLSTSIMVSYCKGGSVGSFQSMVHRPVLVPSLAANMGVNQDTFVRGDRTGFIIENYESTNMSPRIPSNFLLVSRHLNHNQPCVVPRVAPENVHGSPLSDIRVPGNVCASVCSRGYMRHMPNSHLNVASTLVCAASLYREKHPRHCFDGSSTNEMAILPAERYSMANCCVSNTESMKLFSENVNQSLIKQVTNGTSPVLISNSRGNCSVSVLLSIPLNSAIACQSTARQLLQPSAWHPLILHVPSKPTFTMASMCVAALPKASSVTVRRQSYNNDVVFRHSYCSPSTTKSVLCRSVSALVTSNSNLDIPQQKTSHVLSVLPVCPQSSVSISSDSISRYGTTVSQLLPCLPSYYAPEISVSSHSPITSDELMMAAVRTCPLSTCTAQILAMVSGSDVAAKCLSETHPTNSLASHGASFGAMLIKQAAETPDCIPLFYSTPQQSTRMKRLKEVLVRQMQNVMDEKHLKALQVLHSRICQTHDNNSHQTETARFHSVQDHEYST